MTCLSSQRQSVGKPGLQLAPAPNSQTCSRDRRCFSPLMLTCMPLDTVSPLSLWASQLKTAVSVRPEVEGDRETTSRKPGHRSAEPTGVWACLYFLVHCLGPYMQSYFEKCSDVSKKKKTHLGLNTTYQGATRGLKGSGPPFKAFLFP